MANVSRTPAQIRALTENGAVLRQHTAGGSGELGAAFYIASDGDVEETDADASEAAAKAVGVLVATHDGETTCSDGDAVTLCVYGPVSGYSGMTPGQPIYASDDVGELEDEEDTTPFVVGYAESATVLFVNPDPNMPSSS